jgi:hypothetical protein
VIEKEPDISASLKSKVEGICSKASHGDLNAAKAAAKEVCKEVINAAPIPAAEKQTALASCASS